MKNERMKNRGVSWEKSEEKGFERKSELESRVMWGSQIRKGGKQYPDWTGSSWSEVPHLRLRVCVSCLFHLTVSSFVLSLSRACLVVFRSCTFVESFSAVSSCRLDTSVKKTPFPKVNRLCSECCAILYIWVNQKEEGKIWGIWACFNPSRFHLWRPSCQIGLFCLSFVVCRMNRMLYYGLYAD